jgi:hypothetical protein
MIWCFYVGNANIVIGLKLEEKKMKTGKIHQKHSFGEALMCWSD